MPQRDNPLKRKSPILKPKSKFINLFLAHPFTNPDKKDFLFRIFCGILTICLWVLIVFGIHFLCILKPDKVVDFFRDKNFGLSSELEADLKRTLLFLPAVTVTLVKLATPTIASVFEKWEQYPFTTKVAVYSARLFFSRSLALFALVTTLFYNSVSSMEKTRMSCWEDKFCLQLVLVSLLDFAADIFLTFLVRLPRVAIRSAFHSSWNCTTKLTYDPYETMIDVVCDVALMSAGILYCPIIPMMILVRKTSKLFFKSTFLTPEFTSSR